MKYKNRVKASGTRLIRFPHVPRLRERQARSLLILGGVASIFIAWPRSAPLATPMVWRLSDTLWNSDGSQIAVTYP